jgi:hypothetical protein
MPYLRAWKLCVAAAFLAVAAPIVARVEQAAQLLLIIAGGLIALGVTGWWAKARAASGQMRGSVRDARAQAGVRRRPRALVWRRLSDVNNDTTNSPAWIARVLGA